MATTASSLPALKFRPTAAQRNHLVKLADAEFKPGAARSTSSDSRLLINIPVDSN
jgi:hypothetical protein